MVIRSKRIIVSVDGYSIVSSAKTSAGVFNASGTLVRTLSSGVDKTAGTYSYPTWDGKLDDGTTDAPSGTYTIKVQENNIAPTWEGALIGNTSTATTGADKLRAYYPASDMAINVSNAFIAHQYNELSGAVFRIDPNSPQKRWRMFPNAGMRQQITNKICTDGTRLYMGGSEPVNNAISFVLGVNISAYTPGTEYGYSLTDYMPFSNVTVDMGEGTIYKCADKTTTTARVTGMAVQQSGNYLFVTRKSDNSLHVIHKTTGAAVQTLTYTSPSLLAIDASDNLWMAYNGVVQKFTINSSTGALTASTSISGFTNVQGLSVSPDGATIAIADARSTGHQVFGYSTSAGTLTWTLGQAETYATSSVVANNKFYLTDLSTPSDVFTYVCYQPDGSLWVGDIGNYRQLKFNSSRTFSTAVYYQPLTYSVRVDPNNSTRVFADYLEYSIDYTKALQAGNANGAWSLVKNWGASVAAADNSNTNRLRNVVTLSNGRTYAVRYNSADAVNYYVIELGADNVVRNTTVTIPRYEAYEIQPDGSVLGTDDGLTFKRKALTGFDGSGNPLWGSYSNVSTAANVSTDPKQSNPYQRIAGPTVNNIYPYYRADAVNAYHLGGVASGGTSFKFKTSKSVSTTVGDPFPSDGSYDIGNVGTQARGNIVMTLPDEAIIITGYNGEGWDGGGQTNYYNIYSDNGLFLRRFGVNGHANEEAKAEMAGNASSPALVKGTDGAVYMYHNDESYHSGTHRWKITGLNTIIIHSKTVVL
jgi:hypothetical protein